MASQLRFGAFLTDHFAEEIVALRRARERAAEQALHASHIPVAEIEPVTQPSSRPRRATVSDARPAPELRRRKEDQVIPLAPDSFVGSRAFYVGVGIAAAVGAVAAAWVMFGG